jgi:hypothetical protein
MLSESPQASQRLCWSRRGVKISTDQQIGMPDRLHAILLA